MAMFCLRWLGISKMYGSGGVPPPPTPPVPQDRDSHATSLPSLSAATLTRAKPDGRMPATSCSESRSSMIFTGLPPAAHGLAAIGITARHVADLLSGERGCESGRRHTQQRVDIVLEGGKTLGHLFDPLRPAVTGRFVQHVQVDAVRVHRNGVTERAAQ